MKKSLSCLIIAAIALVIIFIACSEKDTNVPVTEVILNRTSATLTSGGTMTLIPIVQPDNATNKNVSWESSNTVVATVNNGFVTAVAAGTATITVITLDGNKTTACALKVNAAHVPVTGVTLNETSSELPIGETLILTATILPENADNKAVVWTSSNEAAAIVNNGTVTPVAIGSTTITVTTIDGGKTATCIVTVPISVRADWTTASLEVGDYCTLTAIVLPENVPNKNVNWASNNTAVATVNNGTVTAVGLGTATIIITTEEGNKTATCVVSVLAPPSINSVNSDTPGWGESLGTVSFASTQTWAVGNQTWSDAVQATGCSNKTTFNGGVMGNYDADCRNNLSYYGRGDFFSWGAVVRYRKQLCPNGWRVPTRTDFVNLDIAMGGTGTNGGDSILYKYVSAVSLWGGAFGGYITDINIQMLSGAGAAYWSAAEANVDQAYSLFLAPARVNPQDTYNLKNFGYALRCVR
ncbi:MAG: Ig-like domain-containing protein [Bacteroidales bacterium]|nr:Ig-like domain-containing protein [Bacteroidales bacterium]MCL2133256.1 Ig-like domain-containing protein [Bacteroidales bacterium]